MIVAIAKTKSNRCIEMKKQIVFEKKSDRPDITGGIKCRREPIEQMASNNPKCKFCSRFQAKRTVGDIPLKEDSASSRALTSESFKWTWKGPERSSPSSVRGPNRREGKLLGAWESPAYCWPSSRDCIVSVGRYLTLLIQIVVLFGRILRMKL